MCLILDTNKYGLFLARGNDDMKPVRDWVDKNGKIVYSPIGKMKKELEKYPRMRSRFEQYRKAGRLKNVAKEVVKEAKNRLPKIRSNDPDIVALAQVSEVKLLVSGDRLLHADFKQIVGGSVYQSKEHRHLLKADLCP